MNGAQAIHRHGVGHVIKHAEAQHSIEARSGRNHRGRWRLAHRCAACGRRPARLKLRDRRLRHVRRRSPENLLPPGKARVGPRRIHDRGMWGGAVGGTRRVNWRNAPTGPLARADSGGRKRGCRCSRSQSATRGIGFGHMVDLHGRRGMDAGVALLYITLPDRS